MSENILHCVNKNGDVIRYKPLIPFLKTIQPAFLEHASEISFGALISGDRNTPPKTTACYKKNGQSHMLKIDDNFHPFVTSGRLRLIAGISFAPIEGITKIIMPFCLGKELINVNLHFVFKDNYETVILYPEWK